MPVYIVLLIIAFLTGLRYLPQKIRLILSIVCYTVFCVSVVFALPLFMIKSEQFVGCFVILVSSIASGWYIHKPEGTTANVLSHMLRVLGYGSLLLLLIVLLSTMGDHNKTFKTRTYIHIMITGLFPTAVLFLARYLHRLSPKPRKVINLSFLGVTMFLVLWAINPSIPQEKDYMGETINYRQPIIPVNFQNFTITRKITVQNSFQRAIDNKMFMMTYDYERDKNQLTKNKLESIIKNDDRYHRKYINLTQNTTVKIDSILKYRTELFEIYLEE
jgi:hypothetical protein